MRNIDRETYKAMPGHITVREARVHVEQPGFRTKVLIVVTTLLDPEQYSKEDLADLVNSFGVVKRFDVLEHTCPRFMDIGERIKLCPLVFERPEESFHHRVVVTTSCAAHRAGDVHRS